MESKNVNQISIDIPNYNGPLEVLLDLAKTQKVDLAEISITKLADQFLSYIKNQKNLCLEEIRYWQKHHLLILVLLYVMI